MSFIPVSSTGGLASSIAQLFINPSLDGQQGEGLSLFRVYLESSAIKGAKHIELTNVCFQNFIYPFHSQNNNFVYFYQGSYYSIAIPVGVFYDETSLVSALNAGFTALGQFVTVGFSTTTQKLTFTTPVGVLFRGVGHFDGSNTQITNRANLKLGFYSNTQQTANGSTVSPDTCLRIPQSCIYLGTSQTFSGISPSNLQYPNLFCRIPLDKPIGQIVNYVPSTDQIFELQQPTIDSITFQIFDEQFLQPNDMVATPVQLEFHYSA